MLFVCLCGCSQHLQAGVAQDEDIHQSWFLKCIRENIIETFFFLFHKREREILLLGKVTVIQCWHQIGHSTDTSTAQETATSESHSKFQRK